MCTHCLRVYVCGVVGGVLRAGSLLPRCAHTFGVCQCVCGCVCCTDWPIYRLRVCVFRAFLFDGGVPDCFSIIAPCATQTRTSATDSTLCGFSASSAQSMRKCATHNINTHTLAGGGGDGPLCSFVAIVLGPTTRTHTHTRKNAQRSRPIAIHKWHQYVCARARVRSLGCVYAI